MSSRPTYPRVNCLVVGCKRGTTRHAPNEDGSPPEIICGPHWRTVPKGTRKALAWTARRYRVAERRDDDAKMRQASRLWWTIWGHIKRLLNEPESSHAGQVPATMATELERLGL